MKKAILFIFAIGLLSNCSDDETANSITNVINIRLSNISDFNFENIIVNTSTEDVNYGDLDARKNSDYKQFEIAYPSAFIELLIDGETFTLQPIDMVFDPPLDNGNYTYQIDASNSQERYAKLSLKLIKE